MRIASSTSCVVATPSLTSHSASRQTASSRRSAIWAGISPRTRNGYIPISDRMSRARSIWSGWFFSL